MWLSSSRKVAPDLSGAPQTSHELSNSVKVYSLFGAAGSRPCSRKGKDSSAIRQANVIQKIIDPKL